MRGLFGLVQGFVGKQGLTPKQGKAISKVAALKTQRGLVPLPHKSAAAVNRQSAIYRANVDVRKSLGVRPVQKKGSVQAPQLHALVKAQTKTSTVLAPNSTPFQASAAKAKADTAAKTAARKQYEQTYVIFRAALTEVSKFSSEAIKHAKQVGSAGTTLTSFNAPVLKAMEHAIGKARVAMGAVRMRHDQLIPLMKVHAVGGARPGQLAAAASDSLHAAQLAVDGAKKLAQGLTRHGSSTSTRSADPSGYGRSPAEAGPEFDAMHRQADQGKAPKTKQRGNKAAYDAAVRTFGATLREVEKHVNDARSRALQIHKAEHGPLIVKAKKDLVLAQTALAVLTGQHGDLYEVMPASTSAATRQHNDAVFARVQTAVAQAKQVVEQAEQRVKGDAVQGPRPNLGIKPALTNENKAPDAKEPVAKFHLGQVVHYAGNDELGGPIVKVTTKHGFDLDKRYGPMKQATYDVSATSGGTYTGIEESKLRLGPPKDPEDDKTPGVMESKFSECEHTGDLAIYERGIKRAGGTIITARLLDERDDDDDGVDTDYETGWIKWSVTDRGDFLKRIKMDNDTNGFMHGIHFTPTKR